MTYLSGVLGLRALAADSCTAIAVNALSLAGSRSNNGGSAPAMTESHLHVIIVEIRAVAAGVAGIAFIFAGRSYYLRRESAVAESRRIAVNNDIAAGCAGVGGITLRGTSRSGHRIVIVVPGLRDRLGLRAAARTAEGLDTVSGTGRLRGHCALVPRVVMSICIKRDGLRPGFITGSATEGLNTVRAERRSSGYLSVVPLVTDGVGLVAFEFVSAGLTQMKCITVLSTGRLNDCFHVVDVHTRIDVAAR